MGDRNVFPKEWLEELERKVIPEERCKKLDDIRLYADPVADHFYQLGIDPSEGSGSDSSCISLWDLTIGEEVAFWKGKMAPDLVAYKAKQLADHFNVKCKQRVMIIPETNGIGTALLAQLKKLYTQIYQREVFMKKQKEFKMVLGWKTTTSTKPLLVNNMVTLLREKKLTIHTPEVVEEMRTFVYTDEVKKMSMGADSGFHDDTVIATMLAVFATPYEKLSLLHKAKRSSSGLFMQTYKGNEGDEWWDEKKHFNWKTDSR